MKNSKNYIKNTCNIKSKNYNILLNTKTAKIIKNIFLLIIISLNIINNDCFAVESSQNINIKQKNDQQNFTEQTTSESSSDINFPMANKSDLNVLHDLITLKTQNSQKEAHGEDAGYNSAETDKSESDYKKSKKRKEIREQNRKKEIINFQTLNLSEKIKEDAQTESIVTEQDFEEYDYSIISTNEYCQFITKSLEQIKSIKSMTNYINQHCELMNNLQKHIDDFGVIKSFSSDNRYELIVNACEFYEFIMKEYKSSSLYKFILKNSTPINVKEFTTENYKSIRCYKTDNKELFFNPTNIIQGSKEISCLKFIEQNSLTLIEKKSSIISNYNKFYLIRSEVITLYEFIMKNPYSMDPINYHGCLSSHKNPYCKYIINENHKRVMKAESDYSKMFQIIYASVDNSEKKLNELLSHLSLEHLFCKISENKYLLQILLINQLAFKNVDNKVLKEYIQFLYSIISLSKNEKDFNNIIDDPSNKDIILKKFKNLHYEINHQQKWSDEDKLEQKIKLDIYYKNEEGLFKYVFTIAYNFLKKIHSIKYDIQTDNETKNYGIKIKYNHKGIVTIQFYNNMIVEMQLVKLARQLQCQLYTIYKNCDHQYILINPELFIKTYNFLKELANISS